jgi:urea transport system ATP-binding protein
MPEPAAVLHGTLLYLDGVTVSFDGFSALDGLSLIVDPGELRTIIGPNGAGKTTMMDVVTGKTRPDQGQVLFDGGIDLTRLDEAAIANLGIGRKFQKPTVFENLSVLENLELAFRNDRRTLPTLLARLSGQQHRRIDEVLGTIGLGAHKHVLAGTLSHGQKQWLEIGMLLVQDAQLLLLDEPVAGMSDHETEKTAAWSARSQARARCSWSSTTWPCARARRQDHRVARGQGAGRGPGRGGPGEPARDRGLSGAMRGLRRLPLAQRATGGFGASSRRIASAVRLAIPGSRSINLRYVQTSRFGTLPAASQSISWSRGRPNLCANWVWSRPVLLRTSSRSMPHTNSNSPRSRASDMSGATSGSSAICRAMSSSVIASTRCQSTVSMRFFVRASAEDIRTIGIHLSPVRPSSAR